MFSSQWSWGSAVFFYFKYYSTPWKSSIYFEVDPVSWYFQRVFPPFWAYFRAYIEELRAFVSFSTEKKTHTEREKSASIVNESQSSTWTVMLFHSAREFKLWFSWDLSSPSSQSPQIKHFRKCSWSKRNFVNNWRTSVRRRRKVYMKVRV